MQRSDLRLGIYEKALPVTEGWMQKLAIAEKLGFDFIEMSIDESDARLERLDWSRRQRRDFVSAVCCGPVSVPSICLSGHRRFPLGSHDPAVREQALAIMDKAIRLAADLGVRVIQLAGYDVYYEESGADTRAWFLEGLHRSLQMAAREQVMLAVEIMDTPHINSIRRFRELKEHLPFPWLTVYPDIGNLSAWGNDISSELELGRPDIVAIHLKDTHAVTEKHEGTFRDVPFGSGCVDFVRAFEVLQDMDYRGPFVIEMWTEKAPDPKREIARSRKWLLERMKEGGLLCQ